MLSQKIIDFIKNELKKGYKPKLIVDILAEKGYNRTEVQTAVDSFTKKKEPTDVFEKLESMIKTENKSDFKIEKDLSIIVFSLCAVLMLAVVYTSMRNYMDSGHIFMTLFVLFFSTLFLTRMALLIGKRFGFVNMRYSALFEMIFFFCLVFAVLQYYFNTLLVIIAILPSFFIFFVVFKERHSKDWISAFMATTLLYVFGFIVVYLQIILFAIIVRLVRGFLN